MIANAEPILTRLHNNNQISIINLILNHRRDDEELSKSVVTIKSARDVKDCIFSGDISAKTKWEIKHRLDRKEYKKISDDVYKLHLKKSIFIYKVYGRNNSKVIMGFLIENNINNLTMLLDTHTKYLIETM